MTTEKRNPLTWLLVGAITLLVLFVGIFSHIWTKNRIEDKYAQERLAIDVRIDSLREEAYRLESSLDSITNVRTNLTTIRTVFKTVYDTVYIKTVPVKILDGLNFIIEQDIDENL